MKLIALLTILIGAYNALIDERLTINRMGYGVMFDKVSEIVDGGGIVYYSHTWSLIIPDFTIPHIAEITCIDNSEFEPLCDSVNSLIRTANTESYELITKAKLELNNALETVVKSDAAELIGDTTGGPTTESAVTDAPVGGGRRRRESGDEPDLDLPDNLDPDKSNDDWEILIPGRLAGNLFTSIFNMPGSGALKNTVRNLKALGGSIYYNTQSILNLQDQLASIMQTTDKRLDKIEEMGMILVEKIKLTRQRMSDFQNQFIASYTNISSRVLMLNKFKSEVVSTIYPQLFRQVTLSRDTESLTNMWTTGLINLASGFLSVLLIPEDMIKNVIDDITQRVLTQPTYSRFNLISSDPAFYYKTKKMMTYARTDNKLIITLQFPMFRTDGRMPLYRIYSFPIPLTAGLDNSVEKGYTRIADLPAFIAVDKNTDSYVEMTEAEYLGCEGAVKGIETCGNSVGVTKRRDVNDMTCAFALFIEDKKGIDKYCTTLFEEIGPVGSARQLSSDSSFLISSGNNAEQDWTINCPKSPVSSITTVKPCNLCRMEISCGCSLSTAHFKLNPRISGCETALIGVAKTTKIYTRNIAAMAEFASAEDLAQVQSYSKKLDEFYPPFQVPDMVFTTTDKVADYAEESEKYGKEFAKGAKLIKKNQTAYATRVDEALAKARNFTDQEVDREGSIFNAIKSLFDGIFGGEVWAVIAMIFSPVFMTILAFIVSLINFIPAVSYDYKAWKAEKREKKLEEGMESLLDNMEEEDDYGRTVKYNRALNGTTFVDVDTLDYDMETSPML